MQSRTKIQPKRALNIIGYNSTMLALGSCFSSHMGQKLQNLGYKVSSNPLGITFNPVSISIAIKRLINKQSLLEEELELSQELWTHPDFHGSFNHISKEAYLKNTNQSLDQTRQILPELKVVILTIGTCWVYKSKNTGQIVNNCHKLPSQNFDFSLLSTQEVFDALSQSITSLQENSTENIQIILTVSPVRHLKNGLEKDKLSKATALLATHQLVEVHPNCHYFPSYELMLDDLRDYRYYQEDMLHPSPQAVDYIYEVFQAQFLDQGEAALRSRIIDINRRKNHRILFPETAASLKFKNKLDEDLKQLVIEFPFLKNRV